MALDFSGLSKGAVVDSATEPRRIFAALPTREPKYARPWDVQAQVWDRWHQRRAESDLLVKMNTGGGKTVVGLLMLKSCLNEGVGPAVYITPDIFLADQVRAEADALGIEHTANPSSGRFQSGKAILVVHIHKIINGRSVFGIVGDTRQRIDLGSVLVDDTHACLATLADQFTLTIARDHPAYGELVSLFDDALRDQSPAAVRDLHEDVPGVALRVPYWSWADQREPVLGILHPHRDSTNKFKFVWPLISEILHLCDAAISYDEIEIKPPCPPIDRVPSLTSARRRIYLTATLADDSVLVTHFDAAPTTIATPVTPTTADDLGDRMILTPQETHPGTTDDEVREFLKEQAERNNVVVIVPSRRRAELWADLADAVHDSTTIHDGVQALRDGHVGLVVLINKYDGIDLPGDACRILALDGLPEAYSALDRIEALALDESDAMLTRQIQRIEQGMGRGVRSNDDYCVVLLLGSRLTQRLHRAGGTTKFSPATRAQLALSRQVAEMLHGQPFTELGSVIDQCLDRDPDWVTASRNTLDGVTYPAASTITPTAVAEREAFGLAELGRYRDAHDKIRTAVNNVGDRRLQGWLKQRAAGYLHLTDPVDAQRMQKSAQSDNKAVLRPRDGVEYHRLTAVADQARQAQQYLTGRYDDGNQLIVGVAALLDDLKPDPDPGSVAAFEQAIYELGLHLGFGSQRPERDTGQGPDVLWSLGLLAYLVIECKSGSTTDAIWRHDAEQLSHSMDWFAEKYDHTCTAVPILIHHTNELDPRAAARPGARVITFDRLTRLRDAVTGFAAALGATNGYRETDAISAQLTARHLNGRGFAQHWGTDPHRT